MDLQKQLDLFHANPPRLFPHLDYQRPLIEKHLAILAATGDGLYEDRLEKYNRMCDEYGVQRFARVIVSREEIAAPIVEPTVESEPKTEEVAEIVQEPSEAPKKRGRKKKEELSPNS